MSFLWKMSHIRPFCYKLYGYNQFSRRRLYDKSYRKSLQNNSPPAKTEWRGNNELKYNLCNVAFTSIHASNSEDWYFVVAILDI